MKKEDIHNISDAVNAIKTVILQGQYEAAKGVNRIQLCVYYGIGRYISVHTRKGTWGTGALDAISEQLRRELPGLRGFSANSLKNMRKFYENWIALDTDSQPDTNSTIAIVKTEKANSTTAIVDSEGETNGIDIYHTLCFPNIKDFPAEDFFRVPFTHHVRIIEGTKTPAAQYYYIHRTAEEHLSAERLSKLIREDAFGHQDHIPNNFQQTLPNAVMARKAVMMFKDEYLLNFINVEEIGERERIDVDERLVEQQIVQNVKTFIMTFGKDFAFIGNQYHLEVYGVEHFPDLLFFNRELNTMVVVELKTGDFKTSYLGQLMTYLRILDDHVRKPHENPSIGIVLCKTANKEFVEYVIQDYHKPMGVATYSTSADMPDKLRKALPDIEDLKKLL